MSAASSQSGATTSAAPSGSATGCRVNYSISNQWPGGFQAELTVENTGSTLLSSWTLTWNFANGQTVSNRWNGSETQSGSTVMVKNLSYDGSIPAGGNYNGVGFTGTWNNSANAAPTSFAINGVACK